MLQYKPVPGSLHESAPSIECVSIANSLGVLQYPFGASIGRVYLVVIVGH